MKKRTFSVVGFFLILISSPAFAQKLKGIVTGGNGQPISSANIVESGSRGIITNELGEYELTLTSGKHKIVFSSVGFESKTIDISLEAGETKTLNVDLAINSSQLNEIVVTGTRSVGRTKLETPSPVDVIDMKALAGPSPQVNLNQILNFVAPSFSSNTQSITDGSDHIDPASLRGLGVDQVLVLVNGKRFHKTSLLNQNGSVGRGQVGSDLNAIPVASIDRIEILRDGAAAQYGSDAIAGVINIILKKQTQNLEATVYGGAFATGKQHLAPGTGWDGKQLQVSLNYGIPLNKEGAFINVSGTIDDRGYTNRQIAYYGSIFKDYNNPQLYPAPTGRDITEEELARRGLTRSDFNMKVGQSALRNSTVTFNSVIPFANKQCEFYSFGSIGYRQGRSAGFYRLPYNYRNIPAIYPIGFLPHINTRIFDISFAAGIRGKLADWNIDFSNIYGGNKMLYIIDNTLNSSLLEKSPTRFNAGGHAFYENTTNFDISRKYENIASGLNLAFGAEHRYENYQIIAGEEGSWRNYGMKKRYVTSRGDTLLVDDVNGDVPTIFDPFSGSVRAGGSQVFPGFKNSINQFRNSYAGYADAELDITNDLLLGAALRHENYSDFGNTTNFKVVTRYKIGNDWAIRGAYNTGFRAPSLHQIFYQNTNTLTVNGILREVGTFSNDSRAAKLLGMPQLKPEQSKGFTAGLTGKLGKLEMSFDYYNIFVKNRVVVTGTFAGDPNGSNVDREIYTILQQANAGLATFYVNAIDTRTQGLDIVLSYKERLGMGLFNVDLSGTFSKTKKEGAVHTPPLLESKSDIFFSESSRIVLEELAPREKINLTLGYKVGSWNFFLRNVHFGPVTELSDTPADQQVYSPKLITDLSISYAIIKTIQLTVGSNNLLDIYPDKTLSPDYVDNGRFVYSGSAHQFGANGRFVFAKVGFRL
ncbi:MAG: TonB-dependent receptor [Chitinophagaceae bacterium]